MAPSPCCCRFSRLSTWGIGGRGGPVGSSRVDPSNVSTHNRASARRGTARRATFVLMEWPVGAATCTGAKQPAFFFAISTSGFDRDVTTVGQRSIFIRDMNIGRCALLVILPAVESTSPPPFVSRPEEEPNRRKPTAIPDFCDIGCCSWQPALSNV